MAFTSHFLGLALATLLSLPAHAHEGEDHGAAPSAPAVPALPRFAATSELFELVGVVDGRRLTVYLDRFEDNAPVQGAQVELDLGGTKVPLKELAPGEFEATLASDLSPGVTAVTASVAAGGDADLLAGELDIHEDAHADATPGAGWITAAVAAAVVAVAAIGTLAWGLRRRQAARHTRVGAAA